MYIAVQNIKDEKRGILQSLKLFTIDICDKYFFYYSILYSILITG
jgi:hypothetical protein